MTTPDLKQKILAKINADKSKPKPRWYFVVRNGAFWGWGVLATIVGSVSVAVVIFIVQNHDKMALRILGHSKLGAELKVFPLVWVLAIGAFILFAEYGIRNTERGYRYKTWHLVAIHIILVGVGGIVLSYVGIGYQADHMMGRYVPGYYEQALRKYRIWMNPAEGFLIGKVLERDEESITLRDPQSNNWQVAIVSISPGDRAVLDKVREVRVVGFQTGEGEFTACRIMPLLVTKFREPLGHEILETMGRAEDEVMVPKPIPIERKTELLRIINCDTDQAHIYQLDH
jgi:hypothetical protein